MVALSILNDGFTLLGVSAYTYDIILGVAILIAMILNVRLQHLARGRPTMTEATPPVEIPDAIRTEHIVKRFGAVTALRDVSMHLMKGEVLGLVGDNGAGKSTLIKILTGFMQPMAAKSSSMVSQSNYAL